MSAVPHKLDFTTFILSVSSAAFMGLGLDPAHRTVDLALAKQNIELLELIKEKTINNLSSNESNLLDGLLFETRMKYVEAQNKLNSEKK